MDAGVFILIYLVVSMMVCLSCFYLAVFRKKKHLILFTLSFLGFCASGVMLALQNNSNIVASVLFGNLFTCVAILLLHASFRSFFDDLPLFPKRSAIYPVVLIAICLGTTLIHYNLILRSIGLGLFYTCMFLDLLFYLRKRILVLEKKVHILLCTSVIANILSYIMRVIFVVLTMNPNAPRFSGGLLNNYVLASYVITSLLWFESIILLDDSELIEKTMRSEEKYRLLAESASEVIWVMNASQNKLTYMSPSITAMRGYSPQEMMQMPIREVLVGKSYDILSEEIKALLADGVENPEKQQTRYVEIQQPHKDGGKVWVEISLRYRINDAREIEILGISRNINERKLDEEKIEYLNTHDALTGLWNLNALRSLYGEQDLSKNNLSVIFLDIDNFRMINDALGHTAGDQMIAEIASKLNTCVGTRGKVFRNNGDEFIVVTDLKDSQRVLQLAEEIKQTVCAQILIEHRTFFLTASIGICGGSSCETLEQAIKYADAAMFISKKTKNTVTFYKPSFNQAKTREMIIEEDLRSVTQNNGLTLHYQPIVDIRTGEITRAEALIRWNHPQLGLIPPGDFIAIAEKTKTIIPITNWIIEQVCKQINEWKREGLSEMSVGINLSAVYIESSSELFASNISEIIRNHKLDSAAVNFEITETTVIQNMEAIKPLFAKLHRRGIGLSLDDFGTGYSSLGYVKDIPLSDIKMDRMFIQMLDQEEKQQTIVQGMISIAHGLGMQVVAEGVETAEQATILNRLHCDFIQGYYFSRPVVADALLEYIRSGDAKKKLDALNSDEIMH